MIQIYFGSDRTHNLQVDSLDETFGLVQHFLLKLSLMKQAEDGSYTFETGCTLSSEQKVVDLTDEQDSVVSNFYGDAIISGEPLEVQILRLIESKGKQGATSNDIASYFGMNALVLRTYIKAAIEAGYIIAEASVSKKTSQNIYIMKKFTIKSEDSNENKSDNSKLKHLSSNLKRIEFMKQVFQKHKIVTRHEIRPMMRAETGGQIMAQIDNKTLKRLLLSMCNDGELMHLVLKGTDNSSNKDLEIYYVPDCDKKTLERKVSLMKEHLKCSSSLDNAFEGAVQIYISGYQQFPNGVPDDFNFSGKFISIGGYIGPKAIFLQRFHLILSVLMYRWKVVAVLPSHLMNLKVWWEYVLKIPPPVSQDDGSYEIVDILNYIPINFLNYIQKGFEYDEFLSVMEHDTYPNYCIGQLPKHMIVILSRSIIHIINSCGKIIELLESMDLVEIKNKFDFTKKSIHGFRFNLRRAGMLLNTSSAPVHKHIFKGYNIRRIQNSRKIMVLDIKTTAGFIEFWSTAKDMCLSDSHNDNLAFSRNISEPAKSLRQVLSENKIECDQPEQFYHGSGTEQRLNKLYSELGPAGFQIKLFFNKRINWCHQMISPELKKRLFRPDIAVNNVCKPHDSLACISVPATESDSDDYHNYSKYKYKKKIKISIKKNAPGDKPKKVSAMLPKNIIPVSDRKRKRQNSKQGSKHSSGLQAAKRVRKKYRDDFDKKATSNKTTERVKFSVKEDDTIITWSVCLKVFGTPYNPNEARDLLHKCCPGEAADKTTESTKKRRYLLLERPEVKSRIVDLQVKGMAYKDSSHGNISNPSDLFCCQDEWVNDDFVVRTILPASFNEFIRGNKVVVPGTEKVNHVVVFLSEGYRNKRIQSFKDCKVSTVWQSLNISDDDKHIFSFMIMSVGSQESEHNEISYKLLRNFDEKDFIRVSEYMKRHQFIRKKKPKVDDKGALVEGKRLAISVEVSQSFYSPFPDSIITEKEMITSKSLLEFHYSDLTARHVHALSHLFYKNACKVIISGAIDPFVDQKKSEIVFQDIEMEEDLFADVHTKKNTFVSGFFSVQEAKSAGFQLSEKHISGRVKYKVHTPNDDDKVEGYEDLLGLKETSWPLPLKIFVDPVERKGTFKWNSVDLETGVLESTSIKCDFKSSPTALNSYKINLACAKLWSDESNLVKLFVEYCKQNELLILVTTGEEMLRRVFESEGKGLLEKELRSDIMGYYDVTESQVDEVIDICLNLEIILRVGFVDVIIIGRRFGEKWLITLSRGIRAEPLEPEAAALNVQMEKQEMETDFSKYFPLTRKPWRLMNTDVNCSLLAELVKSLVMYVYCYPGISKEHIDQRYHAHLSPLDSKEIIECLVVSNILKRCYDKPPSATLFSPTFPAVKLDKDITSTSIFIVTEDGLTNLAPFLL